MLFIVYPLVTKAINAVAKEIPAKNWGHDLNGFLTALSDKTKLIFIANPNNPTGNFLTEAELDAFLAKVPENVIVVLDEAYTEFTHPSERVNSFALLENTQTLSFLAPYQKLMDWRVYALVTQPLILKSQTY